MSENEDKISDDGHEAEESSTDKGKITPRPIRKKSQNYAAMNNPWKKVRPVKGKAHGESVGDKTQNIRRGFAVRVIKADVNLIPDVPVTVYEALNGPDKQQWLAALQEELNSYEV